MGTIKKSRVANSDYLLAQSAVKIIEKKNQKTRNFINCWENYSNGFELTLILEYFSNQKYKHLIGYGSFSIIVGWKWSPQHES